MITRLLIPLDGSALAESVLPTAAQIARTIQGTLILLRIPDVPLSDVPLSAIEAEEERVRTYLAQVTLRPELEGISLETQTLYGSVAQGILTAMQTAQADLLVMSSHGRSGFTRLALGSVAEQVIRHTSVPVLVLHRPHKQEAPRATLPVALVALDGSERAEAALGPATNVLIALSAPEGRTLHLVRIVAPPVEIRASSGQPTSPLEQGERVQEAEDYMLRLTSRLRAEGIEGYHPAVTWSLWVSDTIGTTLAQAGKQAGKETHEALFLAMASHGRGRWTSGSIAMNILEHSTLPLLVVRVPSDEGGAARRDAGAASSRLSPSLVRHR